LRNRGGEKKTALTKNKGRHYQITHASLTYSSVERGSDDAVA